MRALTIVLSVFCLAVSGQVAAGPAPTRSFTVTPTVTPTPSITATFSISPTFSVSPTFSPSPTITLTPTVGEGSYTLSQSLVVTGSQGNGLDIDFLPGATAFPSSGGLLSIFFPLGFSPPNSDNCFVHPTQAGFVSAAIYDGQWAYFSLHDLPANVTLTVRYGMNSTGFAFGSTIGPQSLLVYSYPQSVSQGIGGLLALQPTIVVQTPTETSTGTITPTSTETQTWTVSPTSTPTPTITQTFTETPVAALKDGQVFAYPNPYDMRRFDKVTFRFPEDHGVLITVFNLLGHPVREIPVSDINEGKGWAVWSGTDDYNRQVNGGIYFVRVRGESRVLIKRFTVLR